MKRYTIPLALTLLGAAAVGSFSAPAFAERVLRLDESPVGEIDPAKASDYADSILMFNVYDTLVMAEQGKRCLLYTSRCV